MKSSPTLSSRSSRWLWMSSLLVLAGCSDLLGIDRFDDQGIRGGTPPIDGDDPSAQGADPDDDLTGALMWWSAFGEAGMDDATAVAALDDGVQLAGLIDGAVDFGGGTVGSAGPQAFVVRFDLDGSHQWSVATTGSGHVDHVQVATTSDEGAVIAGTYRGELKFSDESLPAAESEQPSLFIAWLTAGGELTRVTTFPGDGELRVHSVAISPSADVAVAGTLLGSIEVGPVMLTGGTFEWDALLVVVGDDGAPKLATNMRTDGDTRDQHLSVARYDSAGGLWIGGSFRGTLDFANAPVPSIGTSDGIVARVEIGATVQSANVVDPLVLGGGQSEVDVTALVVDDEVTIGGTYSEQLVLGDVELESAGERDLFVARLGLDLTPVWASSMGSPGPETFAALDVDGHGHTSFTGSFTSDLSWSGMALATSNGGHDSLVAKLDDSGELMWARTFGRQGDDMGHGLAVDEDGQVLVAGAFTDGMMLDDEVLQSSGMQDIFVLRLDR